MAKAGSALTTKKYKVSSELQAVIGVKTVTRPDATKKIWEYIKKHDLQDESDKRVILSDATLAKVLGKKIGMLKIAGALSAHLEAV